jgi:hypothetical protein
VKTQHVSKLMYSNLNTGDTFMSVRKSINQEAHANVAFPYNFYENDQKWQQVSTYTRRMQRHVTKLVWSNLNFGFMTESKVKSQCMTKLQ